jgi:hypothetical protein
MRRVMSLALPVGRLLAACVWTGVAYDCEAALARRAASDFRRGYATAI